MPQSLYFASSNAIIKGYPSFSVGGARRRKIKVLFLYSIAYLLYFDKSFFVKTKKMEKQRKKQKTHISKQ